MDIICTTEVVLYVLQFNSLVGNLTVGRSGTPDVSTVACIMLIASTACKGGSASRPCGEAYSANCELTDGVCVTPSESLEGEISESGSRLTFEGWPECEPIAVVPCEDDRHLVLATLDLALYPDPIGESSLRAYSRSDGRLLAINLGGDEGTGGPCALSVLGDPATADCMREAYEMVAAMHDDADCRGTADSCDPCACQINEVWPDAVREECR